MIILPAIDLCGGCAVRLLQGDYQKKTVYSVNPPLLAREFEKAGAAWLHLVDLDGAKYGTDVNDETIGKIVSCCGLKVELGGGIRSIEMIESYLELGVKRIILGTAAATDSAFLEEALSRFGDSVAIGVDVREGIVAIKGWTEQSGETLDAFCIRLQSLGAKTVICTDISKDGMLKGTNMELYRSLSSRYRMNFIASGGVSSLDEIRKLRSMGLYGAIVGKALYTGKINLREAIAEGEDKR